MIRFAAVTPVRNGEGLIAETVRSVVSQKGLAEGHFKLDYLVWDAKSSDMTVSEAANALDGLGRVLSMPDDGIYDGLAKAFELVDGDVFFYLNAGDLLQPMALMNLVTIFEDKSIQWVTGMQIFYGNNGSIVGARMPPRYTRRGIRAGIYGTVLPSIQQESTFWTKEAMSTLDLRQLSRFALAGDFFMWFSFAANFNLWVYQVGLSGFRYHGNHLSEDMRGYKAEIRGIVGKISAINLIHALFEWFLWLMPSRVTRKLKASTRRYNPTIGAWS